MAHLILVDDTDGDIRYDGPWLTARNTLLDIGNFGPPFQQTLHGVNTNASLSYTFTGTQVTVMGSSVVSTSGGPTDPSWECFVDGTSIGAKDPIFFSENNWPLCESGTLSSGSHVIRVVATVRRQNTFWFDRIQYRPTPGASLIGRTVYIDDTDERVLFGDGWDGLRDIAHQTQTNGATVTISFTGTSLTWYGFIPGDFPSPSAEATYSIDGGPETTFFLQGLSPGAMELYNQVFFQTPSLSSGDHTIRVTHRGNSGQTPLTLDYVVIVGGGINTPPTGGGSSSSSSSSSSTSGTSTSSQTSSLSPSAGGGTQIASGVPSSLVQTTPTSTPPGSGSTNVDVTNNRQDSPPVGAIAGGAVGGLALIVILILGVMFLRRRKPEPRIAALEDPPLPPVEPYRQLPGSSLTNVNDLRPVRYAALTTKPGMSTTSPLTSPSSSSNVKGAVIPGNHGSSGSHVASPSMDHVSSSHAGSGSGPGSPLESSSSTNLSAAYGGVQASKEALLEDSQRVNRVLVVQNAAGGLGSSESNQGGRVVRHQDSSGAQEVDELLDKVAASALFNTAEIEDPAKCHPGTREAVLHRLFGALDGRSADPDKPYVWLHGAAGAGKSAIARTLCEQLHAENQLLASFFFFRASSERNTAARLISTLTYQFRTTIPQLRPHIKQYIRANPLIFRQSLDAQAQHLLINPICRLHEEGKLSNIPQTAIVVDGLDECEGTESRRNILYVLHTLRSKLPFPITVLVSSRPNRAIDAVFHDSPFEGHAIEEPLNNERDVDADILKFYTDSFAKIEKSHVRSPYFTRVDGVWPAPAVIELLIEKTSGIFIFAKTVIRFVEPDRSDPEERLQMVLGALPTLHHRPFEQLDAIYKLALSVIEPDQLETTLTVIGLFLSDYCLLDYTPPGLIGRYSIDTPRCTSGLVEWILDFKNGQCHQLLVGLEALLTLSSKGRMRIFHKSFSDFLFDSSRSGEFHIAQDMLYELILRSFIKHHFYHPSYLLRRFMFANMEFLFSNASITPNLLSAIKSVDFVASDVLVRRSPPLLEYGEDSWLRICGLFLRSLLNSHIANKDQLAVPLLASLRIVATNRLRPYLDHPTLWPLLYIATRNNSLNRIVRSHLLQLVRHIPPHLLSLEQTAGYHLSIASVRNQHKELYLLYGTEGPLLEVARAALPEHQSPDSYLVTLLLELVDQSIKGTVEPLFLVSSNLLSKVLPHTDRHCVLSSKLTAFSSTFKEQLNDRTIAAIWRYGKRCRSGEECRRDCILRVAEQAVWDFNNPDPILHRLTDDWYRLEEIIKVRQVLPDPHPILQNPTDDWDHCSDTGKVDPIPLDTPKPPPPPMVHRLDQISLPPYAIPVALIIALGLYIQHATSTSRIAT